MKKYLIPFLYTLAITLVGSMLSSVLYYFNITTDKINMTLLYMVSIISIFIGSMKLGQNINKKGIIAGLIYFAICFIIMLFVSLVFFKVDFSLKNIIYYIILLIFSLLGGIIGKNTKEETGVI